MNRYSVDIGLSGTQARLLEYYCDIFSSSVESVVPCIVLYL